jgi:uncharacterized protein (UPF0303 family)
VKVSMDEYNQLLEELLQQENDLQFTHFTNETAYRIGCRIIEKALTDSVSVTVDIQRNSHQLFHCALDGKSINNAQWIKRKNKVVQHFGRSSYYMGILLKSKQTTMQEWANLDPNEYAAIGGAFPIIIKNVGVVGTVTVSGLPQAEDHGLVTAVLREFCALNK